MSRWTMRQAVAAAEGRHARQLSRRERRAQATQAKVSRMHYATETFDDFGNPYWYAPLCDEMGDADLALDWAAVTCPDCDRLGDAL